MKLRVFNKDGQLFAVRASCVRDEYNLGALYRIGNKKLGFLGEIYGKKTANEMWGIFSRDYPTRILKNELRKFNIREYIAFSSITIGHEDSYNKKTHKFVSQR